MTLLIFAIAFNGLFRFYRRERHFVTFCGTVCGGVIWIGLSSQNINDDYGGCEQRATRFGVVTPQLVATLQLLINLVD